MEPGGGAHDLGRQEKRFNDLHRYFDEHSQSQQLPASVWLEKSERKYHRQPHHRSEVGHNIEHAHGKAEEKAEAEPDQGETCREQHAHAQPDQELSTINANLRGNHWHKSQLDEEINKINKDILDLWAKGVSPSPLMKLRDNMTNIDLDYGAAVAAIAIESVARAAGRK